MPWRHVGAGAVVTAVGLAGLLLWLGPRIERSKHDQVERRRRADAELVSRELQRLSREQALHRARARGLPAAGARGGASRRLAALLSALQSSITSDAQSRVHMGQLAGPILRTSCARYRPREGGFRGGYECVAVTGETPVSTRSPAVLVGYPFWARVSVSTGAYAWCKINPRPGERGVGREVAYLPPPRGCNPRAP